MTVEELLAHPAGRRSELVGGHMLLCEPPGGVHGMLASRIATQIQHYAMRHDLGTVFVETGYVLRRNPDTVRGPDVSFVSRARLAPGEISEEFITGAPDLAVEILSSSQGPLAAREKMSDYFAAGTRVAWIIDPSARRTIVCHPNEPARYVSWDDPLDGEGALPGFTLVITELLG
jgi:Uma2 family endonuclease